MSAFPDARVEPLGEFRVGAVVGAGIAGFMLLRKMRQIESRGSAMALGLEQVAATEVRRVAAAAGEQVMGEVYGLTPERIAGAGRLVQRLQPITSLFQ